MACKTYKEIAKELKPYTEEGANIEEAYKKLREAEYADLADAYADSKAWMVDSINGALPYYNRQRIEVLDIRDGKYAKQLVYKYLNSDKQYKLNVDTYSPLTYGREGVTFEMVTRDIDTLYSDTKFINEDKNGYDERVTMAMNNPEEFYKLGEELANLEGMEGVHKEVLLKKLDYISTKLKSNLSDVIVMVNENAARTGGQAKFDGDKATVYVGIGPNKNGMSALEVYVHEMVHVVTKLAIDSKDPMLARYTDNLKAVRKKLIDTLTEEDVMKYMVIPNKNEAKDILDYISDEKVGLHEFVAYAETNELMRDVLKDVKLDKVKEEYPNMAAKIAGIFQNIVDYLIGAITKTKGKNGLEIAEAAVIGLVNANRRAQEAKRNKVIDRIVGMFVNLEGLAVKGIDKLEEKAQAKDKVVYDTTSSWKASVALVKSGMRATVDDHYKKIFEATASVAGLKPEGTIMTILRDMSQSDTVQDMAERLGLISQGIDRRRNFIEASVGRVIRNGFTRELSGQEAQALTEVLLDTDISSIYGKYDIQMMLRDQNEVTKAINDAKGKIKEAVKNKEVYNYYKNQADGLGYYMVNGVGNIAQMLNAESIARMGETDKRMDSVSSEVVELIDDLATLYAIKYANEDSKNVIADLMDTEGNGVDLVIAYQVTHKHKVEEELFNGKSDKLKLIKGYSKEVYPPELDFKIGLVSEENSMRKLGYKKVKDLSAHKLDKSAPMAMYVSELNARQNLHRVALRYTDKGRKGTSIGEKYAIDGMDTFRSEKAKRDIAAMRVEAVKIAKAMQSDNYRASKEAANLVPVLDNAGRIMDFRYVMSKKDKKELLKMNTKVDTVLGRTYANRFDKGASMKFNDELMKLIEEDAAINYREGKGMLGKYNTKEYIKIEKYSPDQEVRDLWSVLPDYMQARYKEGFVVRRDLMHSYLGYREISMAEFPGLKSLPDNIKHGVRVAEKIWKDIIAISKKNIVLKLPVVLIGNVTSNIAFSVMSFNNPVKVARLQMQGVRDLNRWINDNKELLELQGLRDAGRGNAKMDRQITALENSIATNPATVLVDEGFYTTILEELEGSSEYDTNTVSKYASKVLEKAPKLIRNGAELLYLADSTKVMQFMNAATQYSDFVARYAQYTMLIEKGESKEAAAKEVRDAYVNYNKPNSRALEWANQMGFVMFTKYFTRIQKAIKYQARKHPLTVIAALLAQEWVIGDVDDITDQSMFTKDLGNIFYSPMDSFMRAATPMWDDAITGLRNLG